MSNFWGQGFWGNISIELLGAVIVFFVAYFWEWIPKSKQQYRLHRVFGKPLMSRDISICYGTLTDERLNQNPRIVNNRFRKTYKSGHCVLITGPFTNIVGECEIRAMSYLENIFARNIADPIFPIGDDKAMDQLSRNIISIGSPVSNEISSIIMTDSRNIYFDFVQNGNAILDKRKQKQYIGFQQPNPKDYGLIIKLPNLVASGRSLIMCAGLGESGTSGAAWYYAKHWYELEQKYGSYFGILVEVTIGADESAIQVA